MTSKKNLYNLWLPLGIGTVVAAASLLWPQTAFALLAIGLAVVCYSLLQLVVRQAFSLLAAVIIGIILLVVLREPKPSIEISAIRYNFNHVDGVKENGIVWHNGYSQEVLIIGNPNDKSMDDVDILIKPETSIISFVVEQNFASCTANTTMPIPEPIIIGGDPSGEDTVIASNEGNAEVISSSYRIYCSKIPARSQISVNIATVGPNFQLMPKTKQIQVRQDPRFIDIISHYQVNGTSLSDASRLTFKINSEVAVTASQSTFKKKP